MIDQKTPETITWKAASHIAQKRSHLWYFVFSLVSLSFLAYALYTKSILTFVTFFLIIIVVMMFSAQPSHEITYKITRTGIAVGHILYPYKIIKKFWIVYNPPEVATLNLETTAYMNNRTVLQLGDQDPLEIKLTLAQYLPEDLDKEESLVETLARRLKI